MSDICSVLKAIEFIEAHLTKAITIADVAESASFSLFHFSRTFGRIVRHTPYDYLMRRRLSEAARCLLESDEKIIDVAFKYQFNAPETFSRAFKRMFNCQPRQVKSQQGLDQRQLLPKPTLEYLEFLNGAVNLTPKLKRLPPTRIAGIAAPINTVDSQDTIATLWNLLGQEIHFGELGPPHRDCYGVLMFFPLCPATHYMYLAGISLSEGEKPPSFFVQKDIPAMEYVCFELSAQTGAAAFTRYYTYHTWWPKATVSPLGIYEIEYFADFPDRREIPINALLPRSLCFPLATE